MKFTGGIAEQDTNDRCDAESMYLEAQKQLKKQKTTHPCPE